MYLQFILVLVAVCILTLSISKYKEGQCVMPGTPEAKNVLTRVNIINKKISDQTDKITKISARVNEILLNYSNFKFSIKSVQVDPSSSSASIQIDGSTVSNPNLSFTLTKSPKGDVGDYGNQGRPGAKGDSGEGGNNGFPGYWGISGGCSS
jgi:hypothetical protein